LKTTLSTLSAICAAAPLILSSAAATAQDFVRAWPVKPVTVVIPFPPGGSTEAEGRLYAQKLGDNLGKTFIMDYKPGAATTIGTNYVAKAAADGYTLLGTTSSFILSAVFSQDLPYDPLKDLAPVSLMTRRGSVLLVRTSLPVNTAAEYIAYARANPGKLNVATTGSGGSPHIGAAWLHSLTKTDATFIHYKGSGPLITDLIAGRVDANITTLLTAMPLAKAGKVRIIGVTTAERSALMPEMPTIAEGGAPGYNHQSWWGFMVSGKTPPALVKRINEEVVKAGRAPEVSKKMTEDGSIATFSTPEDYRKTIIADLARIKKLVTENNIKSDE
jgi:tripartite-type tricarboxylate transporter receptor subunit TctC